MTSLSLSLSLSLNAGECFVVRPDNSEDHRKIGSRGAMCLLHVSKWGLTLALQVIHVSKLALGLVQIKFTLILHYLISH